YGRVVDRHLRARLADGDGDGAGLLAELLKARLGKLAASGRRLLAVRLDPLGVGGVSLAKLPGLVGGVRQPLERDAARLGLVGRVEQTRGGSPVLRAHGLLGV